jgi:hypothetical protein
MLVKNLQYSLKVLHHSNVPDSEANYILIIQRDLANGFSGRIL